MDNVDILARFSELLVLHGASSPITQAFYKKYATHSVLKRLFDTAVKVQKQLKSGQLV